MRREVRRSESVRRDRPFAAEWAAVAPFMQPNAPAREPIRVETPFVRMGCVRAVGPGIQISVEPKGIQQDRTLQSMVEDRKVPRLRDQDERPVFSRAEGTYVTQGRVTTAWHGTAHSVRLETFSCEPCCSMEGLA